MSVRVVIAQKGAREHFLAARALHREGLLARLVVDWYAPSARLVHRIVRLIAGSRSNAALASRARDLPDDLVVALRLLGLWCKWRDGKAFKSGNIYDGFVKTDAAFARAVARLDLPEHHVFFGYSYASLEALRAEKHRGRFVIIDQVDPGPAEFRLVSEEMERHSDLAGLPLAFPAKHFGRARSEWELADEIIVNSQWSRDAIVAEGADPAKIEILPLAYGTEHQARARVTSTPAGRPLKVLWLGQVNVRKGIHYLLEAARLLAGEPVEFQIAGRLEIRSEAAARAPMNVKWLGTIPRSETSALYRQADVFVLPTLSDGFALSQLEALAHGLPAIVTPNCGRVVEDGRTGFVVPARDPEALAAAIRRFIHNRKLVVEMSPRCVEAAKVFSIEAYGRRLVSIIENGMERCLEKRRKRTEDGRPLENHERSVVVQKDAVEC